MLQKQATRIGTFGERHVPAIGFSLQVVAGGQFQKVSTTYGYNFDIKSSGQKSNEPVEVPPFLYACLSTFPDLGSLPSSDERNWEY